VVVLAVAACVSWGCSKDAPSGETKAPADKSGTEKAGGEGTGKAAVQGAEKSTRPTIPDNVVSLFGPLPDTLQVATRPVTPERVALGRMLYYDTRFSKNHDISCNSCHNLEAYGVDGQPTSPGHKGQRGDRNSPTVYNAAGHFRQFWDGRAADVEEQAKGPVLNPVEMAMPDEGRVLATIKSMPEYVDAFAKAFPEAKDDPVTYDNFGIAIGAFERTLTTPSRFDQYLKGDPKALTDAEVVGFKAFVDNGCTTCHSGPLLGGRMYQKLGLFKPYPDQKDLGRFQVTQKEEDKLMFKVPSLRNIEKTGPYFHDGSVATLEKAVELMAWHQVGKKPDAATIASIVTFLKALTGEIPKDKIAKPELPKSTDATPKPDPT
jgi:cytochrome c peroxidase